MEVYFGVQLEFIPVMIVYIYEMLVYKVYNNVLRKTGK